MTTYSPKIQANNYKMNLNFMKYQLNFLIYFLLIYKKIKIKITFYLKIRIIYL